MKIFPTTSIKQLDADTIKNEPIASIDLMERASRALARAIAERWEPDTPLTVFAGPGNNGGDALALARLLAGKGYRLEVYLFNTKGTLSPDCETNKERLADVPGVDFHEVTTQFVPPVLTADHVVIDGWICNCGKGGQGQSVLSVCCQSACGAFHEGQAECIFSCPF